MNTPYGIHEQMSAALRSQAEHARASHTIDRTGWTRQQWIDDARQQFNDLHGSVQDLLNGHVSALLAEIDAVERRVAQARAETAVAATSEETIREAAEELAYAWWPEQTVQDDPELVDVCMRPARALAEAGLLRQNDAQARAETAKKIAQAVVELPGLPDPDPLYVNGFTVGWRQGRTEALKATHRAARQHAEEMGSDV